MLTTGTTYPAFVAVVTQWKQQESEGMPTTSTFKLCRCHECGVEFMTAHKRKFCTAKCSSRSRNKGAFAEDRKCLTCNKQFTANAAQHKCCTTACARKHTNAKTAPTEPCLHCGDVSLTKAQTIRGRKYCSLRCRKQHDARSVRARQSRRSDMICRTLRAFRSVKWCGGCNMWFRNKGDSNLCRVCHGRQYYRETFIPMEKVDLVVTCGDCGRRYTASTTKANAKSGRLKCSGCRAERNRQHERTRRRRKRSNKIHSEPYSQLAIYDRDCWTCYMCGTQVQRYVSAAMAGQMPNEATIDHVWPLCEGGWDTEDNVRTACRECNTAKGTTTLPGGCVDVQCSDR